MAEPVLPVPHAVPEVSNLASAATQMALGLLLVLAVILVAFWLLRRYGPKFGIGPVSRGGLVRVLAQVPLGQRKSLVVVRFLNREMLLGVTDQTITLLTEGATAHETASFADTLSRADPSAPNDSSDRPS